ncbi:MAG TPA: flagellar filament capping protein FliD [Conexibacter sp.]|jgi:flagellar hook-associated protein 2|nr:flagellar filament capping protein FliD [Conexibacter sp.]
MSTSSPSTTIPLLNIGGLASGLDTNAIVTQLMAVERQPRTKLDTQASLVTARQSVLADFQSRLRAVEAAAQDLRSVSLWAPTQATSSSDPTRVSATIVAGSGAGVGGYQVEVSQLAGSAQRTYAFTRPASAGTITIDGHATAVAAGASIGDVVSAINEDTSATVYAAATDSGTLVLSSRRTGDTGTGFIAVTDPTGALAEQAAQAKQGRDALFKVDGVAGSSSSSTNVTNAIPGVSLTLGGVTTVSGPITVTVGAPSADPAAVKQKLQAFVDVYNSTVDAIRARLDERTVKNATTPADQQAGMLNGDTMLTGILSQMRQAIYTPVSGLPAGMSSLADLGVSTGSASSTISRDSLAGKLTIDATKLSTALSSNPAGVRDLLAGPANVGGWARSFERIVHDADTTGGTIDIRIVGDSSELKQLQQSMADMDQRLALRETTLRAQFTAMETALAQSKTQGDWLTGQIAALPLH